VRWNEPIGAARVLNFRNGSWLVSGAVVKAVGRVVLRDELIARAGRGGRGRQRVFFTNGCFDLLHPGHVRLLERAASLGDILVVGVNSDRTVRRLKGAVRPLLPEAERAELLASLAVVDYVVIFDQETPREVIASLLPDVLVKGADWGTDEIVGREEVEAAGGKVVSMSLEPGYSTTTILEQIRAQPGKPTQPATR
jgi:rfaE bifunctional protein nucleotidyltransferase chain/domain